MYYDYFGLNQPPFRITPDTSLFFPGGDRGAILEALVYAVKNGEGMVKVVGEVGSGKTMLCRMLEKELPDRVEVVYLANPSLSPENILHAIAFELKLPVQSNTSRLHVMNKLQQYLLERHSQNRQVVVFVEEAQGMPIATLEQIRLLSNLETRQHKLLQIVLFGQPELDQRISHREIRQLRERITYSFYLNPFKADDIREYVNSRLRACGYRSGDAFTRGAVRAIERFSRGLVRRINILADKSLLAAYADNTHQVTTRHVRRAAADSEFVPAWYRLWKPAAAVACLTVAAIAGLWWITSPRPPEPAVAALPVAAESARIVQAVSAAAPGSNDSEDPARGGLAGAVENLAAEPDAGSGPGPWSGAAPPGAAPALPAAATGSTLAPEEQLMDLGAILDFQEVGDTRLSPEELAILWRQLQALPPEDVPRLRPSSAGDACKLCWSIIYRPLINPENL